MRLIASLVFAAALLGPVASSAQTPPTPPVPPTGVVLTAPTYSRYERASEVQLRDVVGFVRVRPENRSDVAIAFLNSGPVSAPQIRIQGRKLVIDGGMRRQVRSCRVLENGGFAVVTRRHGTLTGDQLPVIELRVPQNVVVAANGAVRMRVGPSVSATIAVDGCGDADIERVQDAADLSIRGTPDVRVYEAGELTAALAGAGEVRLGVAHEGLTVSIAGSGDFDAARADGPVNIAIQGAGDVMIRDGRATTISVAIAGAGDVTHNGSAESLDAVIFGAGDVHVGSVSGEVSRSVIGAGEVTVGR
jgi:hypothetical protein